MEFLEVSGIKTAYDRCDGNGTPVLLLHGWGASREAMSGLFSYLRAQKAAVISPDLPYFGMSDAPPETYGVYEYAEFVLEFLRILKIEKVNIIAHSFGGRLALILAAKYKIAEKIVLIDSAGIKPKKSIKKRLKILSYKLKKKLFKSPPANAGSADYKNLPAGMKKVFVRVVNTHLDGLLEKIDIPVLILWGGLDNDTPLYMAKKLNKGIRGSGLVIFENAGHYSYLDKFFETTQILNSFLLGNT